MTFRAVSRRKSEKRDRTFCGVNEEREYKLDKKKTNKQSKYSPIFPLLNEKAIQDSETIETMLCIGSRMGASKIKD